MKTKISKQEKRYLRREIINNILRYMAIKDLSYVKASTRATEKNLYSQFMTYISEPTENAYIFDVKYSNIDRLVQSNPIMAKSYNTALTVLYSIPNVDSATLTAIKHNNCWMSNISEPTKFDILSPR